MPIPSRACGPWPRRDLPFPARMDELGRAVTAMSACGGLGNGALSHYHSHRIHGAGIYANIWGILMVNVTIYIAYMDPMGLRGVGYGGYLENRGSCTGC
jgi:hypothetical protein